MNSCPTGVTFVNMSTCALFGSFERSFPVKRKYSGMSAKLIRKPPPRSVEERGSNSPSEMPISPPLPAPVTLDEDLRVESLCVDAGE